MSRSFGGWAPYVPVAARRRKAEREMEKLRKKGRRALAGEDRGTTDRQNVLGQGVV